MLWVWSSRAVQREKEAGVGDDSKVKCCRNVVGC